MPICTTEAVVLNRYVLGDSSLLVAVYTKDFGKIKVVARGARSSKSKIASALEPFTHVLITFRRKEQRELQALSHVEVIGLYRRLTEDLTRMAYAGAVAELINRLMIGEEPNAGLFSLILETQAELNAHPPEAGQMLFWGFQIRFLKLFGYAPQFLQCPGCHRPLNEDAVRFSPSLGGVLCSGCFGRDPGAFSVSLGTVKLLTRIQLMPLAMLPRLKPSRLSQREIKQVMRSFFLYHTEDARELQSLRFLESLDLDHTPGLKPVAEP